MAKNHSPEEIRIQTVLEKQLPHATVELCNMTMSAVFKTYLSNFKDIRYLNIYKESFCKKAWNKISEYNREVLKEIPNPEYNKLYNDILIATDKQLCIVEYNGGANRKANEIDAAKHSFYLEFKGETLEFLNKKYEKEISYISCANADIIIKEVLAKF